MRSASALLLVGCLEGCFLLAGRQAGAPDERGVQCPSRPDPICGSDEEVCYVSDRTVGCSYRQCVPTGQCRPDR